MVDIFSLFSIENLCTHAAFQGFLCVLPLALAATAIIAQRIMLHPLVASTGKRLLACTALSTGLFHFRCCCWLLVLVPVCTCVLVVLFLWLQLLFVVIPDYILSCVPAAVDLTSSVSPGQDHLAFIYLLYSLIR